MPADLLLNEDRRPATINYKTSDPADELAVCPCSKLGGGSGGGGGETLDHSQRAFRTAAALTLGAAFGERPILLRGRTALSNPQS